MEKFKFTKILKGCIENNRKAQEQLYKHYFALMYYICKDYEVEREEILSLVNEGFLKVFMNIASFDEEKGNFEAWAKKIITNNCIDHVRKKKTSQAETTALEDAPQINKLSIGTPVYIEEEILYHLKKMPAATREVFSMHIFKGFSHKEIAQMMNIAESTSRWHILEARKILKKVAHKIL